ncbi:MAG: hypothetical protein K2X94_04585 [Amoebophilaceae bacterium]|nr:hypothetical protein [Amoebophilaceae bacterium]
MQINKNYKVGLLALCSCAILYYGFWFLKGRDIFSKTNGYYVSYPVNKNLFVSAPVKLRGHVVGMITKIEIVPNQNYSTLAKIEVDKKFPLTEHSKVLLNNAGVMEANALELELHEGKPLKTGAVIVGQIHPDFNEIDIKAMTTQVTTVTSNLIKTTQRFNDILGNIEKTSFTLSSAIDALQHNVMTISDNIMAISIPLADPKKGVPRLLTSMHKILTHVESIPFKDFSTGGIRILKHTETLLQNIADQQGTMGLLIHDKKLYNNLLYSSKNLDNLLFSIRKHPQRYVHFSVFGSK